MSKKIKNIEAHIRDPVGYFDLKRCAIIRYCKLDK